MNINGINRLIAVLRTVDNSPTSCLAFDMRESLDFASDSSHPCGSATCIGGWCQHILRGDSSEFDDLRCDEAFNHITGCGYEIAQDVCYPDSNYDATVEQAIQLLEMLRDTGKGGWDLVLTGTKIPV